MNELTLTVPPQFDHERVDKVFASLLPELSRAGWQRIIDEGLVTRAGVALHNKNAVRDGDVLSYSIPAAKPAELKAVDIPLEVLHEDAHLVAINKASGMIVHPGAGTGEDTLVHALLSHCEGELSGIGGVERPGIVHRLDRETSGVMLVAKSDAAHRGLAQQFSERTLHKEYVALVDGTLRLLSGVIDQSIGRHARHRHKMAVVEAPTGGRDAVTDWEVLEAFPKYGVSLVRCIIHTGRTHQIRVHMKWLGHTLLGDQVYGWKANPRLPIQPQRVMLHAEHLVVKHPISGKTLDLRAPLPDDFASLLNALRERPAPTVEKATKKTKPARKASPAKRSAKKTSKRSAQKATSRPSARKKSKAAPARPKVVSKPKAKKKAVRRAAAAVPAKSRRVKTPTKSSRAKTKSAKRQR